MTYIIPKKDDLPVYGAISGISLPLDEFELAKGLIIRRGLFEMFSFPMLAFKEAPPGSHTPGPWAAVHGGFQFKSRAELAITDLDAQEGYSASRAAWLVAALLRLRIPAPIRIAAIANTPLALLPTENNRWALAFEAAPFQIGSYLAQHVEVAISDLEWLARHISITKKMLADERFLRSFSIFDEATWSGSIQMSTIMIWTALEILFNVSNEKRKTKILCGKFANHIRDTVSKPDELELTIRSLYEKRGRIVHAGREIDETDFASLYSFSRAAFGVCLDNAELPPERHSV